MAPIRNNNNNNFDSILFQVFQMVYGVQFLNIIMTEKIKKEKYF